MTDITYYVALPFLKADGDLVPGEPAECQSATAAMRRAEALARLENHAGAVAFSRTGDPTIGDFQDAVLLRPSAKCLPICPGCESITSQETRCLAFDRSFPKA